MQEPITWAPGSCNRHEFEFSLWWPHIQVTFLRDWEPGFEVFESLQFSCPCTLLCSLALQSTWLPGVESPLRSVRSNWQMRAAQISALFCKYISVKVKLHWVWVIWLLTHLLFAHAYSWDEELIELAQTWTPKENSETVISTAWAVPIFLLYFCSYFWSWCESDIRHLP